jgi:CubicO group peptidase (beta-lactamase class C family)
MTLGWTIRGATLAMLLAGTALHAQVAPQSQPTPQTRPAATAAALPDTQALFDGYIAAKKMPGIVGAFGVGDAPTQFVEAGHISLDAGAPDAGPDSLWRIYSMTKPVTAMAAMILVEEGKLKLDQPISDFFPAYKSMKVLTSPDTALDSVPAKTQITVRHLLTHTAGLTYSIAAKGPLLKEVERLGLIPAAANAQAEAVARPARPKTLAEFAERAATVPLIAEPGTKWSYSMGLDVLAAVVEKAAGQPFESFVQARLFTPLKMTSTYWSVPAGEAGRFATNYLFAGDSIVPFDPAATSVYLQQPSFPYGGAGLVSSARDYDRFLHMLQNGGELDGVRVMKAETAALAMSNLLPPGVTFEMVGGGTGGTQAQVPMGYGAGGSVYLADNPAGASKGTYGWGGAAGTIAWVDPVRKARGTVMVNYFPADKWPLRQEVPAALLKDAARTAAK